MADRIDQASFAEVHTAYAVTVLVCWCVWCETTCQFGSFFTLIWHLLCWIWLEAERVFVLQQHVGPALLLESIFGVHMIQITLWLSIDGQP